VRSAYRAQPKRRITSALRLLREVIRDIEPLKEVELIAIGQDVTRYYRRAVTIVDAEQLGGVISKNSPNSSTRNATRAPACAAATAAPPNFISLHGRARSVPLSSRTDRGAHEIRRLFACRMPS
jgi:cobaltochelatase CobT